MGARWLLIRNGIVVSMDDAVFVAGRAVKRHGTLVGADLDCTFRKLEESRSHIGEGGLRLRSSGHGPDVGRARSSSV